MKRDYWAEFLTFMAKHKNSLKEKFISEFPNLTIESESKKLAKCMSFSFKYFDTSQVRDGVGQDFKDWTKENLVKFCNKLKEYCKKSIGEWMTTPIGSGVKRRHVLESYKGFPSKSDFKHPKHVPLDVVWARFRLEGDMRLIGFLILEVQAKKYNLNPNVFYIVFLDEHHQFYKI